MVPALRLVVTGPSRGRTSLAVARDSVHGPADGRQARLPGLPSRGSVGRLAEVTATLRRVRGRRAVPADVRLVGLPGGPSAELTMGLAAIRPGSRPLR